MKRNIEKNSEKKFNYYIDVIKEFAGDTYQKFFNRYIELNNINDKNYVLPNSVLDIDDVLQDYYIKAYELLHDYYANDCHTKVREYLNINLSLYQIEYLDNKFSQYSLDQKKDIILDDEYYVKDMIKQMKQEKIRKQTLKHLNQNEKLQKYHTLIQKILSGCDYDDIYLSCGLTAIEVNIAIEEIGNIYNSRLEEMIISPKKYKLSDINKYNSKTDYYINYLNNKVYDFYNVIYPYFLVDYHKLLTYFSDNILQKNFKLNKFLEEPDNYLYILNQIISDLKTNYLKQYFNLNIDSIIFNSNQFNYIYLDEVIIKKIKKGDIFEIPFYHKYLFDLIKDTYRNIKKYSENIEQEDELYIEMYNYYRSIIFEIAQNYLSQNKNLDKFNLCLQKSLEVRKDNFIYQHLSNSKIKQKWKD